MSLGEQLRDEGMAAALAGQKAWRAAYGVPVRNWFSSLSMQAEFIGEELRQVAEAAGVGQPRHHNAWGANAASFIRKWMREGRIVQDGFRQAETPRAHARQYPRYVKVAV